MGEADPEELLAVAVDVARQAAALAVALRVDGIGEVGTKSTATDLVTAADRAVERLIVELLRDRRPGDEVLGEEYGGGPAERMGARQALAPDPDRVRWVVDPIDGTVNYVYGLPHYAVSVAAEVHGASVAGVVVNAPTGEEWTAVRGCGAWRDGHRLVCSQVADLGRALVATGFGYDDARRAHQAAVLPDLLPRVRDVRRFGAASIDLCFAAEARVDAYFEKGLNAWDHAAGGLVAVESGLLVTGLRGAPPGPAMVLAAPPALHPALHALLVERDADGGP
jgi:myo-inositol-1(or 4)-monophosphatase